MRIQFLFMIGMVVCAGVMSCTASKTVARVGFGSPDIRYPRDVAPADSALRRNWEATAWKNERVHTQLLIWSDQPLDKVSVQVSDLKSTGGEMIPASAVTTGFVRYVITDSTHNGSGCGIPPRQQMDSSVVADGIEFSSSQKMAAHILQPVWVSVQVPAQTATGTYSGTLKIIANEHEQPLPFTVHVINRALPSLKDAAFHLDLWQNPFSVARVHKVQPWSNAHLEAMKPYMTKLADAGQKAITVSMIHDPWQGQTHDIYTSMIKWVKQKDGGWHYDYSIFDQWVQYMMDLGIDQLINCYSMVPWNNKFYYYDESLGKDTFLLAKTGTKEYSAHWRPMLTSFMQHLQQKGWYNKTAIAMDERPLEDMQKVIALVKSVDRNFKISLAGTYHTEIAADIYDYCVASAETFDSSVMRQRLQEGLPTTFYTCCAEAFPNTFTFSPPAESTWLGWHAAAKNYTGYLRWAYNCWPEQPWQDSRFRSWSAGDTYLVYPGPGSSIRFERLIEGIQDYEKIHVLKNALAQQPDQQKLQELQQLLAAFEISALKTTPAARMLQEAKAILNRLAAE